MVSKWGFLGDWDGALLVGQVNIFDPIFKLHAIVLFENMGAVQIIEIQCQVMWPFNLPPVFLLGIAEYAGPTHTHNNILSDSVLKLLINVINLRVKGGMGFFLTCSL